MRLVLLVLSLVLAVAVGAGGAVQPSAKPPQPNFSGDWALQEPATAAPTIATALIVKQTITDTTAHGKPMAPWYSAIEIERQFATEKRIETHRIGIIGGIVGGIRTDGKPMPDSGKTEFSTQWDGDRLVFIESFPSSRNQETWSLDAKGRLVVVVTDQGSGLESKTWTLVYRRFWFDRR